jgi:hypothetical protein
MDLDISSLTSSVSFWEGWGYVALAAVLLGVAGESIEEFTDWPKRAGLKKPLTRISALVLIAGLAGEGITQPNTNAPNATLVAVLNKEARELALESERLRARIAWRHLDKEQITQCIVDLSSFPRQKVMAINTVNDPEVLQITESISAMFSSLGWGELPISTTMGPAQGTGISVSIATGSPKIVDEAAKTIVSCLNRHKLKASLGEPFDPDKVLVLAGGALMVAAGLDISAWQGIILWVGAKPLE